MSVDKNLTDKELSILLKNGEEKVFSVIYDRYWAVLFQHARRMTRNDELAKDVVQDVFINLWDKASELNLNHSLSSYLYTSIRNKIINLYDKEKVKTRYLDSLANFMEAGENITDHLLREKMLSVRIEKEIAQLPKGMKQIFEMSRKDNKSYKAIADDLNISDKTVKKQISNAIKILRLKLNLLFF